MASQRTMRAAVRVEIKDPDGRVDSTGSGFIVSQAERLILTARHCITSKDGEVRGAATLYFTDPDSERGPARVAPSAATLRDRGRGNDDWALLQAAQLPEWRTTELRLLHLESADQSPWSTYGFPADGKRGQRRGRRFGGQLRQTGPALAEVHDPTAIGRVVAGISGGPLVVEEEVIGVITRADQDAQGRSTTGLFYVLPLAACAGLAQHEGVTIHREPAFLEHTASALGAGIALPDAIVNVFRNGGRGDPYQCITDPHRHLARCLLLRRLEAVARVIAQTRLPRPQAKDVVEYAACQWYPRESAILAAQRLVPEILDPPPRVPPPRVVSVSCANNDCASRFVRRAGFDTDRNACWDDGRVDVGWRPYEPDEALLREIGWALAGPLRLDYAEIKDVVPDEVGVALRRFMARDASTRQPVFYWVPLPEETRDASVEALHRQYPELGVVVLGPPRAGVPALPITFDKENAADHARTLDEVWADVRRHFDHPTRRLQP